MSTTTEAKTTPKKSPGPKEQQQREQRERQSPKKTSAPAAPAKKKTIRSSPRTEAAAAPSEPAAAPAVDLFDDLVALVKSEKIGSVKPSPRGNYARVIDATKKTIGYVYRRRSGAEVFPQALAAAMPAGLKFTKCELGSHHHGRGEVIVPVNAPDDFELAVDALKAAAANPIPKTPAK